MSEKKIIKIINKNKQKYNIVIASFSFELLERIKSMDSVFDSFLIKENLTVFDVSKKVIKLCKDINVVIDKYIDKTKLLHYLKHIEGGYTSARVQELLILEIVISRLFKKYNIAKVVDIIDETFILESDLIKAYTRINTISYRKLVTYTFKSASKILFVKIKPYLYEPYRFIKFLKFKFVFSKKNIPKDNKSIVLALNSDANKFMELYYSFYKQLERVNTQYFFLTSSVDKNSKRVKHIKDKILMREHYENFYNHLVSVLKMFIFLLKLLLFKRNIIEDLGMKNRFIKHELMKSLFYHIIMDTGFRYRYKKSMELFLKENYNNILGFKLWGQTSLVEGEITNYIIKKKFPSIKTLGFEVGIGLKNFPFTPKSIETIDFIITSNEIETDLYKSYGVKGNQILQLEYFKNLLVIDEFKKENTTNDSKKHLGISKDFGQYILIDIGVVARGYQSRSEIYTLINNIPFLAKKYSNFLFLIKPHPGFQDKTYLHAKLNNENIIIFKQSLSILHFLNVSDIVITKFSTIGREAILFDKLVVSLLLDSEDRWKAYGEAAIYIQDLSDLVVILDNLQENKNQYKRKQFEYKTLLTNMTNSVDINYLMHLLN